MSNYPLVQLTLMRMREFIREPEALFWSMIFPLALAAGLGIAFRNRPPEILRVAAVTPRLAEALRQEKLLDVTQLPPQLAEQFVRTGKVALVAEPAADGSVVYRYDDTNPEGRQARMLADQAIQRASGRQDAISGNDHIMREPGSRYIDFLIPGLIGMGIMGNSMWGPGFSIVDARRKKLLKRIVATPMPKHDYLLSYLLWRMILLPVDVGVPLLFGVWVFGVPLRGSFRPTTSAAAQSARPYTPAAYGIRVPLLNPWRKTADSKCGERVDPLCHVRNYGCIYSAR